MAVYCSRTGCVSTSGNGCVGCAHYVDVPSLRARLDAAEKRAEEAERERDAAIERAEAAEQALEEGLDEEEGRREDDVAEVCEERDAAKAEVERMATECSAAIDALALAQDCHGVDPESQTCGACIACLRRERESERAAAQRREIGYDRTIRRLREGRDEARAEAAVHRAERVRLGMEVDALVSEKRTLRADVERLRDLKAATTHPVPLDEWGEDIGPALWWRFPISEPPYCGTPLDDDFPACVTHWTMFRCPDDPAPVATPATKEALRG